MEILFVRHEQKDWKRKPDPCGNAQLIGIISDILEVL